RADAGGDRAPRLCRHPGLRIVRRDHRGGRQPADRSALRLGRPAHKVCMMSAASESVQAEFDADRRLKPPSIRSLLLRDPVALTAALFIIVIALAALSADLLVHFDILHEPL